MMGFISFLFRAVFFWVMVFAAGFAIYWALMPDPVTAHSVKADAIVVVTGGQGRVGAGIALLQLDRAPRLFISGVGKGVRVQDVLREAGIPPEVGAIFTPRIVLGYMATNTYENGHETAEWTKAEKVLNVILVSSSYHLPRAELELKMAAPDLHITPFAVDTEVSHQWWKKQYTTELMVREFLKTVWVAGQYGVKTVTILVESWQK